LVELPGVPQPLGQRVEPRRLGDRDDQLAEPAGEVADRRRVVDHRRRHLVDDHLPRGVGLLLVEAMELGHVDPELAAGPLAEPEREGGAGAVHDGGGDQDGHGDDGQARQSLALPGQASLLDGGRIGGPKLGPGWFGTTFTKAHGSVSATRGQRGSPVPRWNGPRRRWRGFGAAMPAPRLIPRRLDRWEVDGRE
jgi:hypothetical protein